MPDHDAYRQYYEEIAKRQLSNNEAFDKAILSLSSAGLALSLTFFKFVVPAKEAVSTNVIENAWFLFLAAIISTLLSYVTSQRALALELKHAEKYYLEDLEEYESKNNLASNLTEFLNVISALFFIGAIGCVVYFVTQNI
jgi:hypothetical protein